MPASSLHCHALVSACSTYARYADSPSLAPSRSGKSAASSGGRMYGDNTKLAILLVLTPPAFGGIVITAVSEAVTHISRTLSGTPCTERTRGLDERIKLPVAEQPAGTQSGYQMGTQKDDVHCWKNEPRPPGWITRQAPLTTPWRPSNPPYRTLP